jgi:hypothetical protein
MIYVDTSYGVDNIIYTRVIICCSFNIVLGYLNFLPLSGVPQTIWAKGKGYDIYNL